ncbi:MAG TPA: YHS domain-containing protein, partial [Candidatus Acidoferrum sp.]|nr:YHS domain-containing protein [Candidatus Acidoferrum sp.]
MERDPVCGMNVEPAKAAATKEFAGKTYFFCGKGCAAKFEKEPERYLSGKMPEGMQGMGPGHGGGLVSIGRTKAGDTEGMRE